MAAIQLNREAATALLKEARRDLENGAQELWTNNDETQRPTIDACVEVIGRLSWKVDGFWPQEETPFGDRDVALVEFEFEAAALDWVERTRTHQEPFVRDLDTGADVADPGYIAEQVYLLHVLNGIAKQREAVAA